MKSDHFPLIDPEESISADNVRSLGTGARLRSRAMSVCATEQPRLESTRTSAVEGKPALPAGCLDRRF